MRPIVAITWLVTLAALGCHEASSNDPCGAMLCGSGNNGGSGAIGGIGGAGGEIDAGTFCTAQVVADLVLYRARCIRTWVQCDGERQPEMSSDQGGESCEQPDLDCDHPAHDMATRSYQPRGRVCELCTAVVADADVRCTPLPRSCGQQPITHIASGSVDEGPLVADCGFADAGF